MEIEINDTMWIASYPMMEYKVLAEIKREKNIQYELECTACNHCGDNCKVLVGKEKDGKYRFCGMVNYDEDENPEHTVYHKGTFYKTKNEALIQRKREDCDYRRKQIKKAENQIKIHKEHIKKEECDINTFTKELLKTN